MAVTPVMTARAAMAGSHRSRGHCGRENKRRHTSKNPYFHRNLLSHFNRSQRLWFRFGFDRRQRIAMDHFLEAAQPLIDRDQFDNGAPRVDEILE
jgi:hypothetical protein